MSQPSSSNHPQLHVQADWHVAVAEKDTKFWLSCSSIGSPTAHGYAKLLHESNSVSAEGTDGFTVSDLMHVDGSWQMKVSYGSVSALIKSPATESSKHGVAGVSSLDVSPQGDLFTVAGANGALTVCTSESAASVREFVGHKLDVTFCRFFPSGMVVLSGGVDMTLRVWSVEDGSNAVTFKGHTARVTDAAMIDRGRNVISCSKDGTLRLWDCASASEIAVLVRVDGCSLNACCVGADQREEAGLLALSGFVSDPKEVGTLGQLALVAADNGEIIGVNIGHRKHLSNFRVNSKGTWGSANCCAFLVNDPHLFAAGFENGTVAVWDVRQLQAPVSVIRRAEYAISGLTSTIPPTLQSQFNLLICTSDGVLSMINTTQQTSGSSFSSVELTGSDCDPIYSACVRGSKVHSICRDGRLRVYNFA